MSDHARLVLLGRPGCHLCEEARAVLQRIGEPFVDIDIDGDDELFKRYLERIPVLRVDGQDRYEFFVDEADLRRVLGRA